MAADIVACEERADSRKLVNTELVVEALRDFGYTQAAAREVLRSQGLLHSPLSREGYPNLKDGGK